MPIDNDKYFGQALQGCDRRFYPEFLATRRSHRGQGCPVARPVAVGASRKGKQLLSALLLCAAGALIACSPQQTAPNTASPYREAGSLEKGEILHLATGRLLTEDELHADLSHYRVVYVGETHDNLDAHAVQLAILAAMHERAPGQLAVGMEMLRRPHQGDVDAFLSGESDEKTFVRAWEQSWGPRSFDYYRDILVFSREHGIPVLALSPARDLEAVVARDWPVDDPDTVKRLPEMDLTDTYYRALLAAYFEGHSGGSEQSDTFHRIQVLRDETMAETAASFLGSPEGKDRQLLVITGSNHVRYGFGVPRRLYRRLPLPYVVIDTVITDYPPDKLDRTMKVDLPTFPMPPADFLWGVGYEDLAAQQVLLGVHLQEADGGGARIETVGPGSAAEAAGLRPGDIVTGIDGEPVRDTFDLTYHLSRQTPGGSGRLEVLRDGQRDVLKIDYRGAHPDTNE
jgi:uncharacterized iron-regulated protein